VIYVVLLYARAVVVVIVRMVVELPAISTKVVCSNPAHGEVYSIQHNVIKFVSELQQVGGFLHQ
jgi:hypothetical protein